MAITNLPGLSPEIQRCLDNCTECHAICEHTAIHCLGMGGEHAGKDHQTVLRDCAQTCTASADFMLRGSALHPFTCFVCSEACRRCAESCERLAGDDETMRRCIEVCRRCETSCREMSQPVRSRAYAS